MISLVKPTLKKLTAAILPFLFTFAVWCSSLANPGLSLAWGMPGCSQNSSPLEKPGCPYPMFSCVSVSLLSQGALASVKTDDFSKDAQCVTIDAASVGSPAEISLAANRLRAASLIYPAQKAAIHLFNSVLTL
ncbi:MAG: hypothetical protein HYY45_08355 [Deltaproteobacteria bacterium]|nr:hypothetical protein [Deltaproteobacteria bacterium]MBI3060678.1 hypothetical protein [Deltaproteobacteria bacterium]